MVQSYNPSHKFSLETVRRNLWEDEAQRRKERLIWGKGQVVIPQLRVVNALGNT